MLGDNILILGGNGLVGSEFTFGKKIGRKDADLTDISEVASLIERENPKWVINCAGYVGGVQANMNHKMDFFYENMMINMNVIKVCMEYNIPNVISFLSTCIFPDEIARNGYLNETHLHKGEPHESNYPYAYSKRMIDVLSRIARDKGLNYSCIIPCNIYGMKDNYNLENSHIIPALIHKFYKAYYNSRITGQKSSVEIWGTGNPIRQFIYAGDIPMIISGIIENNIHFDNMIISPPNGSNIRHVVEIIKNTFDRKYPDLKGLISVEYNHSKPDGQLKKVTDIRKFKNLLPFEHDTLTPFEVGIDKSVDYFIKNYENNKNNLRL